MTYQIPELDSSSSFEVEWRGKTYLLPKMASITFEQMSLVEQLDGGVDDLAGVTLMFQGLAPDFATEVLPHLTPGQLGPLITAWQADSGVSVGESVASSAS